MSQSKQNNRNDNRDNRNDNRDNRNDNRNDNRVNRNDNQDNRDNRNDNHIHRDRRNNDSHNHPGQLEKSRIITKNQEISHQIPTQKSKDSGAIPNQNSKDSNTSQNSTTSQKNTSRLSEIFRDVPLLYLESQQAKDPAKKTTCYYKIAGLNSEAKNIISNLEILLNNMSINSSINIDDREIDILLDLVSTQNLSFHELTYAVEKFSSILGGLPSKPNIKGNIEEEMIYEEEDIASEEL